jgi:hypothetical protein
MNRAYFSSVRWRQGELLAGHHASRQETSDEGHRASRSPKGV